MTSRSALILASLLSACGGGWSDADTRSAADAVHLELAVETICGRGADDAGTCRAPVVRALERAAYCANASMLARHGGDAPDGGIRCKP